VTGKRGRSIRQLPDDLKETKVEIVRGSTISHYAENWLWKRQWACRCADYGMN